MRWWALGLSALAAFTFTAGCSDSQRRMVREEVDKYNMKSYNEGNARQLNRGATLNVPLLKALRHECSARGIRLTHETYAEGLNGNITYSYFINGDARHFILVHVYPSESERVEEMKEMYGARNGSVQIAAAEETSVIAQKGKAALVYASSGNRMNEYRDDLEEVFDNVLARMNVQDPS
ncbi:hypothetical protein J25TS5_41920 [Paenibacillus faecis]|uniref:hypothetical protein n=1 Tax=Paenibacillus TaxID=44249 RepID=UPI001B18E171|nr:MULTISPECIES: hypothetical protein [Paenibacillus]MCA1294132.1 hypothetical protein [Paenibacillus sp. alder61]GIO87260.1 hypothetical protein J25TS5_41920 [Paenibacillus faecis]